MFSWHYSIKYLLKFNTFFLSVVRDNNSHMVIIKRLIIKYDFC